MTKSNNPESNSTVSESVWKEPALEAEDTPDDRYKNSQYKSVAFYPLGYPNWAAYQNSNPTFRVYKRFGTLRNRILLHRQQELAKLEVQLNALDAEEWNRAPMVWSEMKFLRHRDDFFEIPSYLAQKHLTGALGDYCAKHNFMRENYALKLGLTIDCEDKRQVAIGSGKNISTAGTVKTSFRFQDEPQSYSLTFHLLPNCIHNVILGKPFLKATRTFSVVSHFARRVKSKIMDDIGQHHLLYLGESAPRFQGMINGTSQDALADSGAKVMIMDEDYALSLGLSIKTGKRNETTLRFADNSTANTSGMIYGVSWEFGPGGNGDQHNLDFHVLKNAPASVILSDTFSLELKLSRDTIATWSMTMMRLISSLWTLTRTVLVISWVPACQQKMRGTSNLSAEVKKRTG